MSRKGLSRKGMEILTSVHHLCKDVKRRADDQKHLHYLGKKGQNKIDLLNKLNQLIADIESSKEILEKVIDNDVIQRNLKLVADCILEIYDFFVALDNHIVLFFNKSKLKIKLESLHTTLQARSNQLWGAVSLESISLESKKSESGILHIITKIAFVKMFFYTINHWSRRKQKCKRRR